MLFAYEINFKNKEESANEVKVIRVISETISISKIYCGHTFKMPRNHRKSRKFLGK